MILTNEARRSGRRTAPRRRVSSAFSGGQLRRSGARAPARSVGSGESPEVYVPVIDRVAVGGARAGGDRRHRSADGPVARSDRNGVSAPRGAAVARRRRHDRRASRRSREPRATDSRAWVERIAVDAPGRRGHRHRRQGRCAASTAVDVWVFERRSGRREASRVAQEPTLENAAERLAIRAIEVLRSNLVEIDLGARGQRGATVAREPPAVAAQGAPPPAPGADRVGLEAGAAVVSGLDGVGPALSPIVRFGWAPGSWLVLQGTVAGLGSRPTVMTAAGGARVAQQYGLLGGLLLRARAARHRALRRAVGRRAAHGDRRPGRGARAGALHRAVVIPAGRQPGRAHAVARPVLSDRGRARAGGGAARGDSHRGHRRRDDRVSEPLFSFTLGAWL